jgi:hypothetical protein
MVEKGGKAGMGNLWLLVNVLCFEFDKIKFSIRIRIFKFGRFFMNLYYLVPSTLPL